jgi:hypothetical protein
VRVPTLAPCLGPCRRGSRSNRLRTWTWSPLTRSVVEVHGPSRLGQCRVDGRLTGLTLDQVATDALAVIEVRGAVPHRHYALEPMPDRGAGHLWATNSGV